MNPHKNVNMSGGPWTQQKLKCIKKYLEAYITIFKGNARARKLKTYYIDAFAGSGFISNLKSSGTERELVNSETQDARQLQKGSAAIALEIEPSFDQFLFIEKSKKRAASLEELKQQHPKKAAKITIIQGDANKILMDWCKKQDWRYKRAVVLLDPFGMQVEWKLLEAIASTKAIDLWLLFPIGLGPMRLLTKDNFPCPEWCECLTRCFGTKDWETFYEKETQSDFFEEQTKVSRVAGFEEISLFAIERLKSIFPAVSQNPLVMKNSCNNPMYLFCFAASNEQRAKTALNIANHILKSG